MHKKELRVQLRNIKEQFPLSLILRESLVVDARDMSMICSDEVKDISAKPRQTARKSTNSKLKHAQSNIPNSTNNLLTKKEPFASKREITNSNATTNGVPNEVAVTKNTTETAKTFSDLTATSSSTVLEENKLKIVTTKCSKVLNETKLPSTSEKMKSEAPSDDNSTKSDEKNLSQKSTSSSETVETPPVPAESTVVVDSKSYEDRKKPPIKLLLSTVNGVSSVQRASKSRENTPLPSDKRDIAGAATQPSETSPRETGEPVKTEPKVSPLSIIQNGRLEVVKNDTAKKPKSSIEKVVQNLNMKQNLVTTDKKDTTSNLKRRSPALDENEVAPKKPKATEPKSEVKSGENAVLPEKEVQMEDDKKPVKDESYGTYSISDLQPTIKKFVQESVLREAKLRFKYERKCEDYLKLKEKYENVERNFQSWIEFANKLQARVKKIAYALHKQQDSVKSIHNQKEIPKHNVYCQTGPVTTQIPQQITSPQKQADTQAPARTAEVKQQPPIASNNKLVRILPKQSSGTPGNTTPQKVPRSLTDVIDLTEESEAATRLKEKNKIASQSHLPQASTLRQAQMKNTATKTKAFSDVISGPNVSPNQQMLMQRVLNQTTQQNNSAAVYNGGGGTKYSANSTICYGDKQTSMLHQSKQPTMSTHSSSNRMTSAQSGKTHPAHFRIQNKLIEPQPKKLPYPPLPSSSYVLSRVSPNALGPPPELLLVIKRNNGGIVLSWSNLHPQVKTAEVKGYELYAYQENSKSGRQEWRKIGEETIAAMDLPMACTLTQFSPTNCYYFAVRGKDLYGRYGPFSKPCTSKELS